MRILFRAIMAVIALSILVSPAEAKRRKRVVESEEVPPQTQSQPQQTLTPPNEAARFLAGMPVPNRSSLAPLTQDPAWQEHSAYFEKAFAKLNTRQLSKLHTFQDAWLPESKTRWPVVYYMFSGPDFLYLDQFFPNAEVYIMCGKESMGPPPDPPRIANLSAAFHNLENAMYASLTTSYFITKDMKVDLQQQQLNGTLPILYVFLARAGKTIRDVTFISLESNGNYHVSAPGRGGTPGVKIEYTDNGGRRLQTLFYFTTDISDGGISANPGFMNFCSHYGVGASFLKSSSYLMFESGFNRVRDFVLNHSSTIVQDDSGIPLANFNRQKWNLRFFGRYLGPISIFKEHYQPALRDLFTESNPPSLGFGFGYRWSFKESNLIVAQRN